MAATRPGRNQKGRESPRGDGLLGWGIRIFLAFFLLSSPGFAGTPGQEPGEDEPRRVWLAVATDGETARETWEELARAARLLITLLSEDDQLGLVAWRERLPLLPAPAPLRAGQRLLALNHFAPGGRKAARTVRFGVLGETGRQGELPPARAALVVLAALSGSDSGIRPGSPAEALLAYCRRENMPLFVLELGSSEAPPSLQRLAQASGGRHFRADTPAELAKACLALFQSLKEPQMAPLAGQTVLFDAAIQRAVWFLPRLDPRKPAFLTDPQGRVWRAGDGNAKVNSPAAGTFDLVVLREPQAGVWQAHQADLANSRCFVDTRVGLAARIPGRELRPDLCWQVEVWLREAQDAWAGPSPTAAVGYAWEWCRSPEGPAQTPSPSLSGQGPPQASGVGSIPVPPGLAPGLWDLRIRAAGPGLRRERLFQLNVLPPLYQVVAAGPGRWRLKVAQGAPSRGPFSGWLSLTSQTAALAGAVVQTAGEGELVGELPRLPAGNNYEISLTLTGRDAQGRPVLVRPAVLRGSASLPSAGETASPASWWERLGRRVARLAPSFQRQWFTPGRKRRLLWLLTAGSAAAAAGLGGWYGWAWWQRRRAQRENPPAGGGGAALLAAEQLNTLLAEKARLEAQVQEMSEQLRTLQGEKAALTEELKKRSQEIQEKSRAMNELEQEARKARHEVQAVQEEYTALYGRTPAEKKALHRA